MEIHQIIKNARNAKGMTQKELAQKMGVSQPHMADLENGRNRIYVDDFVKIIKLLNAEQELLSFFLNTEEDTQAESKKDKVIQPSIQERVSALEETVKKIAEKMHLEISINNNKGIRNVLNNNQIIMNGNGDKK